MKLRRGTLIHAESRKQRMEREMAMSTTPLLCAQVQLLTLWLDPDHILPHLNPNCERSIDGCSQTTTAHHASKQTCAGYNPTPPPPPPGF